jgi:N-glycosylase/DNA lyase
MQPDTAVFQVRDYDLAATLGSGQVFRWKPGGQGWSGVVGSRWVRLTPVPAGILAEASGPVDDWQWLKQFLQVDLDLAGVLATFPDDQPLRAAVASCRGLRLLRQHPWECLASFILSSTKQIVQIQQIVGLLCERYGESIATPPGEPPAFAFPTPARLAEVSEPNLRACKMGFRAPYLCAVAGAVASGEIDLENLAPSVALARERLMALPGVGRKIADCVLLFAYGFQEAFPVDVWVLKALRELYFSGRRVKPKRLHQFANTHFGSNAGYAQQYLFHYMRTRNQI